MYLDPGELDHSQHDGGASQGLAAEVALEGDRHCCHPAGDIGRHHGAGRAAADEGREASDRCQDPAVASSSYRSDEWLFSNWMWLDTPVLGVQTGVQE